MEGAQREAPGRSGTGRRDEQAGRATLDHKHSNSPINGLLDRLERVKSTGPDRWIACCPAHDDATPSLSIREVGDERVLVHCFAGCGAADVVAAVGLTLRDLFPERHDHRQRPVPRRERWVPRDVLAAVADEVMLVVIAAEQVRRGEALDDGDMDRLSLAEKRVRAAAREVGLDV